MMVDYDSLGPSLQLIRARILNFLLSKLSRDFKFRAMSILQDVQRATFPYSLLLESHMVGYAGSPICTRVSKNCAKLFCHNFFKFPPILIICGRKMAKRLKLCDVHSFFTSANLRHHTTMLNADVPNCYTVLKVVSIRSLTIASSIQ